MGQFAGILFHEVQPGDHVFPPSGGHSSLIDSRMQVVLSCVSKTSQVTFQRVISVSRAPQNSFDLACFNTFTTTASISRFERQFDYDTSGVVATSMELKEDAHEVVNFKFDFTRLVRLAWLRQH